MSFYQFKRMFVITMLKSMSSSPGRAGTNFHPIWPLRLNSWPDRKPRGEHRVSDWQKHWAFLNFEEPVPPVSFRWPSNVPLLARWQFLRFEAMISFCHRSLSPTLLMDQTRTVSERSWAKQIERKLKRYKAIERNRFIDWSWILKHWNSKCLNI